MIDESGGDGFELCRAWTRKPFTARSGDGESVGTPRTATAALPALSIGYHGFRDAAFPGSRCRINGLVSDLRHWSSLRLRRYEQRRSLSPSGRSF
jgi:hypothetical protein